jgi:Flp pilus assembly protein TadG
MSSRAVRAERMMTLRRWNPSLTLPGTDRRRFRHFRRGQAMLEMLIVLVILIPLIFGSIELSRGIAARAALDSGIGTAVRALAVNPSNWGWATGYVASTVAQNVFGDVGLGTVFITASQSNGDPLQPAELAALTYGSIFCLEGSVEYLPMVPLMSFTDPITIKVKHCGVVERVN